MSLTLTNEQRLGVYKAALQHFLNNPRIGSYPGWMHCICSACFYDVMKVLDTENSRGGVAPLPSKELYPEIYSRRIRFNEEDDYWFNTREERIAALEYGIAVLTPSDNYWVYLQKKIVDGTHWLLTCLDPFFGVK